MSTLYGEIERLEVDKAAIKAAIEEKGGTVDGTLDNYAEAIRNLPAGGGGLPLEGDYGSFVYAGQTVQVTKLSDYLALAYKAGDYDYDTPYYYLSSGSYQAGSITSYTWGTNCLFTPAYFLAESGVTTFTNASPVEEFGPYFLARKAYTSSAAFQGPLNIPNAKTIGEGFLYQQSYFTGELIIPETVTSIGNLFLPYVSAFKGPIVANSSTTPGAGSFASSTNIEVSGPYAAEWAAAFPSNLYVNPGWPDGDYLTITTTNGETVPVTSGLAAYKAFALGDITGTGVAANNVESIAVNPGVSQLSELTTLAKFPNSLPNLTTITGYENLSYVTAMLGCFQGCAKLNSAVTLPPNLQRLGNNCFQTCALFNSAVTFPSTLTEIGDYCFQNLQRYNTPITFNEGLQTIGVNCFEALPLFNQEVVFPAHLQSIGRKCLVNCAVFNSPVTLPGYGCNVGDELMSQLPQFNQPVTQAPGGASFEGNLLNTCNAFNSPITLTSGEGLTWGPSMLSNCALFNQPVTIPTGVVSIGSGCLYNLPVFNSEVTIPNTVTNLSTMFLGSCPRFAQPLELPSSLNTFPTRLLSQCEDFIGPLSVSSNTPAPTKVDYVTCSYGAYTIGGIPNTPSIQQGIIITGPGASAWQASGNMADLSGDYSQGYYYRRTLIYQTS